MTLLDFVSILAWQIIVGGISGLVIGYLLRKLTMIFALFLGIGAIAISYLAYRGVSYRWIITTPYIMVKEWALGLIGQATWVHGEVADLIVHIPFLACFTLSFYTGFKRG